jgi:hypothetical protein
MGDIWIGPGFWKDVFGCLDGYIIIAVGIQIVIELIEVLNSWLYIASIVTHCWTVWSLWLSWKHKNTGIVKYVHVCIESKDFCPRKNCGGVQAKCIHVGFRGHQLRMRTETGWISGSPVLAKPLYFHVWACFLPANVEFMADNNGSRACVVLIALVPGFFWEAWCGLHSPRSGFSHPQVGISTTATDSANLDVSSRVLWSALYSARE